MQMAADDGNVTVTRIFRRRRVGHQLVLPTKIVGTPYRKWYLFRNAHHMYIPMGTCKWLRTTGTSQ